MDENCDFIPDDLWKKLAEYGIFDRSLASSPYEYLIIQEEIATASVAVMLGIGAAISFGQGFIAMLGTDEQRQEFLPKLAQGDVKMCMALTEPGGGTDILGSLRTTAVEDGGHYILNGQKVFITGAHVADYIVTIAITDPNAEDKSRSWSTFLVDAKSPGITIRKIPKLGVHACGCCEIFYENVRVPKENLLGPKNKAYGFLVGGGGGSRKKKSGEAAKVNPTMMALLNMERVSTAICSLGIAKAAHRDALEYSLERTAFGKPIGQFQIIQNYLVEMAIQIENARNLIYGTISRSLAGQPAVMQAQMAKIVAARASEYCAVQGMEILGGWGYTMEYDMQRHFRDYKQMVFAPITDEMAINVLARMLGLPKSY
jgi:alkylation response protein AidB-like acyl-CoA dehydrogenase